MYQRGLIGDPEHKFRTGIPQEMTLPTDSDPEDFTYFSSGSRLPQMMHTQTREGRARVDKQGGREQGSDEDYVSMRK